MVSILSIAPILVKIKYMAQTATVRLMLRLVVQIEGTLPFIGLKTYFFRGLTEDTQL